MHKGIGKENLRDHMSNMELVFNMLGESVTTEITKNKEAQGFSDCQDAAKEGGEVAGNARLDAEKKIGKTIVSDKNYLDLKKKKLIEDNQQ